jgi:hypothetical protein
MIDISTEPLEFSAESYANWARIVFITLAALALLASSFVLGRMTTANAGHSTILRPVVVTPAPPARIDPLQVCHLRGPC